jgi:hypothetical protein
MKIEMKRIGVVIKMKKVKIVNYIFNFSLMFLLISLMSYVFDGDIRFIKFCFWVGVINMFLSIVWLVGNYYYQWQQIRKLIYWVK